MTKSELLRELHEANQRLQWLLTRLRIRDLRNWTPTLDELAERDEMQKDHDEYIEDKSLGGRRFRERR